MTIQNISFLPKDINGIMSLLFDPSENGVPEIELRFGKMEMGNKGPYFNTDIQGTNMYDRILLSKKYNNIKLYNDTIYYKDRYRKIVSETSIEYQNKIKSSDKDIQIISEFTEDSISHKGIVHNIRLSKAYEKPISESEWDNLKTPSTLSVRRTRTSFEFNNYKLDFTIKEYSNGRLTHELEAEFYPSYMSTITKTTFPSFMVTIKGILSHIFPDVHSIYSKDYYEPINTVINTLLKKVPEDIRPKNIDENDNILTNFAVTNKLDGVGYNVIPFKQGNTTFLIAFNSSDVWKIPSTSSPSDDINFLSKAEIKEIDTDTFEVHFFDTLYHNNKSVANLNLFDRLNISNNLVDYCNKYFSSPSLTFEIKQFVYTKNIKDDIYTTLDSMNRRYGFKNLIKYNDGIIFQHISSYTSSPAIKWKFPSKVTIDFLFKKVNSTEITTTYSLNSKIKPGTFKIFTDNFTNREHYIEVTNTDIFDGIKGDSLNNKVVELALTKGEWVIHRIRFDKPIEKTNHIKTAHATFVDMYYEFTLPYLLNLIDYTSGKTSIKPEKKAASLPQKEFTINVVDAVVKKDVFEEKNADIKWLFPATDRIKGQRITNVGLKTITRPKDAKLISDYIIKKYREKFNVDSRYLTITDAMAGVGGSALSFKNYFKNVIVVENEPLTFEVLQNNLKLYGDKNITYFEDDFMNVVNNVEQDIVFLDPFYIFEGKELSDIIKNIKAKMIVIKLSKNVKLSIIPHSVEDFNYYNIIIIYPDDKIKEGLSKLREHANLVKKDLISKVGGSTVVDIGAGLGGDIFKYNDVAPKELYLIEPSENNLKEMKERLSKSKQYIPNLQDKIKVLKAGGEETKSITEFVGKKVDFVNMFFSLTFFFKDRTTLLKLVDTIDNLLNKNGIFMGTVMNGEEVQKELLLGNLDNETFSLKKKYTDSKDVYGKEITCDLKSTKTATEQTEYLVFLQELEYLLAERGIFLKEDYMSFNDTKFLKQDMSPEEIFLNRLYTTFVFQRKVIDINEKEIAPLPIRKDKEVVREYWYRKASPGDGSCLFHSVLMNIMGEQFDPQTSHDLRTVLANTFTLQDYSTLQNGVLSMMRFHVVLQSKMTVDCFSNSKILSEEDFKKEVDSVISNNSSVYNIIQFKDIFISHFVKLGFSKDELEEVLKGFYISTYIEYSSLIRNCRVWADDSMILLLSERLKINIIVISSFNSEVYKGMNVYNPDYISVVIFNINNEHFEPMVKRLSETEYQTTFTLNELGSIL